MKRIIKIAVFVVPQVKSAFPVYVEANDLWQLSSVLCVFLNVFS